VLSGASWTQGVEVPTEDALSTTLDQCGQELVYPFYVNMLVGISSYAFECAALKVSFLMRLSVCCIDRARSGPALPCPSASNELFIGR
jgi:hypothetical protein